MHLLILGVKTYNDVNPGEDLWWWRIVLKRFFWTEWKSTIWWIDKIVMCAKTRLSQRVVLLFQGNDGLTWAICLCPLYVLQSRRCAGRCTGNIINPSPWWTHGYSNRASACIKKGSCTWWSCTRSPWSSESYWKACGSAMCLGWRLQPTRLHETCSSSLLWT